MCRSPKLIAAYRALHRLRVPRHPRLAFARLTTTCSPAEHARSTTSDQISVSAPGCPVAPLYFVEIVSLCDSSSHDHYHHPLSISGSCAPSHAGRGQTAIKSSLRETSRCVRSERQSGSAFVSHPKVRPTRCSVKEVIQPQVPLRLPCYDFAPVIALALGGLVPCGFRHRLRALTTSMA